MSTDEKVLVDTNKKSTRCKFLICCCTSVVLVLAVMIPVGILVIAPKIGQSAIDLTTFHILNSTIYSVPQSGPYPYGFPNGVARGLMFATVNVHSPMILGAKLHDVNVTMVLNQPGCETNNSSISPRLGTKGFSNGPVGWFTMPGSTISQGDNLVQYGWDGTDENRTTQDNVTIYVNASSNADGGFRMMAFAFAAYSGDGVVYIDLVAEPKLTALGFITLKTKMKKTLACSCLPVGDIPNAMDCTFPKLKPTPKLDCDPDVPCPDYVPNSTNPEDANYYSVSQYWTEVNKTKGPPGAGDGDAMPPTALFCEPVDDDSVYNTYNGHTFTTTTTTTTAKATTKTTATTTTKPAQKLII